MVHEKEQLQEKLSGLLIEAIAKNIPNGPFGIFFSGGVDSSFIAMICKQLDVGFTCYTVGVVEPGMKPPEDVVYAKKVAKQMGFPLKIKTVNLSELEPYIKKTIAIVGDIDYIKISVGTTMVLAAELAQEKIIFGGLGSEEIFAGYDRHKVDDVNKACEEGLASLPERDLSRDNAIAKHFGLTFKTPFLEPELVEFALTIPGKYKVNETQNKIILREIAEQLGLPKEFAQRKKRAAQYGSNVDRGIAKLAKNNGYRFKKEYLQYLRSTLP